jgi:hypothetical protein
LPAQVKYPASNAPIIKTHPRVFASITNHLILEHKRKEGIKTLR